MLVGITVTMAVPVRLPEVAVIVTGVENVTLPVVTVKGAVVCPAGIVICDGMLATAELLVASVTVVLLAA